MSIYIEKVESKAKTKKKPKPTYKCRVVYRDEYSLKRTTTKSGFPTRKEAKLWGSMTEAELQKRPADTVISSPTVAEIWEDVCRLSLCHSAKATQKIYESAWRHHIAPKLAGVKVKELSYRNLQLFFNELKVGQTVALSIRTVISKILEHALKQGLIMFNPIHDIELHYEDHSRKRSMEYVSYDDFEWLLDWFENHEKIDFFRKRSYQTVLMLCYYLGLRCLEAYGTLWDDIDLDEKVIHVQHQMSANTGEKKITDKLKTKHSNALLPIPDPLVEWLKEWRETNRYPYVVCDEFGCLMSTPALRRHFKMIMAETGKEFHLHALRHTFITNLVKVTDPKTASKLARHSSPTLTLQIYTEVQEDRKVEAIEKAFNSFPKFFRPADTDELN